MLTVIVFILIVGVLIFVHELGHFLTARKNGIRVSEFGFGFPPRIIGFQFMSGQKKTKKWRLIWGKHDGDDENEKVDLEEARENQETGGTIYSLNWIPLGGFVKIKGENGDAKEDLDSFAAKSAWTRIKVLIAGVLMNFLLAWFLISFGLMLGAPESIESNQSNPSSKIKISEVVVDSPANLMGLKVGDEILKNEIFENLEDVQNYINVNKGKEITLYIKRGNTLLNFTGMPRENAPAGQGLLGIGLTEISIIKYSFFEAVWKGLIVTVNLILTMILSIYGVLKNLLFTQKAVVEIAGPLGIAILTKQVTELGLVYIIQFAAILSVNLGIINALPFPALDGGRILFILIEKVKGSPISQKTEQMFHTIGFILLITLMIFITFKDVTKFFK
jgi:regulator of sigma E protease